MCCLATPCPIALFNAKGAEVNKPCPCLYIGEDGVAVCDMITEENKDLFGVGKGCCISARLIQSGREVQFADVPEEQKRYIVATILRRRREGATL
jgi:hypothetical protein